MVLFKVLTVKAAHLLLMIGALAVILAIQAAWIVLTQTMTNGVLIGCMINTFLLFLGLMFMKKGKTDLTMLALLCLYQGVFWVPEWVTYALMVFVLIVVLKLEDFYSPHQIQDEYKVLSGALGFILAGYVAAGMLIGVYAIPMTAVQVICLIILTAYCTMRMIGE
jgi:hypothetical protein